MNYPVPNPRVISTKEEKPFELYLEKAGSRILIDTFAFFLQKSAYEWIVDYTQSHDNYLPPQQTIIFSTTEELLDCLRYGDTERKVSTELFLKLASVLPESSWYVHPTYPLSVSERPTK